MPSLSIPRENMPNVILNSAIVESLRQKTQVPEVSEEYRRGAAAMALEMAWDQNSPRPGGAVLEQRLLAEVDALQADVRRAAERARRDSLPRVIAQHEERGWSLD